MDGSGEPDRSPRGGTSRHPPCPRAGRARYRGRLPSPGAARGRRAALLPGVLLMAADPLDQVLRLVADGKLTAEEAAPILAALDEPLWAGGAPAFVTARPAGPADGGASPPDRRPADRQADGARGGGSPSSLRIEVRDGGRNVVNLRLPIAVGRFALDRVPGLSGEQVDRVRDAMNTGFRGPVLVVDDGDSGVRIVLE